MAAFPLLEPLLFGAIALIPVLLLLGAYRALIHAGKTTELRSIPFLALLLFAWFALAIYLASAGVFRSALAQPFPYIGLAILGPIVLGIVLTFKSKTVQECFQAVPQNWLIGVQLYRIEGGVFLILYAAGLLPLVFAIPAGYGDLLIGLSAIPIAALALKNPAHRFIALWNWLGILDLVIALGTGFLSAPSRYQLFSRETPNVLIGTFPLVLIPIYLVPISILLHLGSLAKLREARSQG